MRPAFLCDAPGEVVEDAANASFVQAGAGRQFREGQTLAPQTQQFLVGWRTQAHHPLPHIIRLNHLAGTRVGSSYLLAAAIELLLAVQRPAVSANAIEKAIVCDPNEKRS